MGGAFSQMKSAVDPMKSFSKIFEVIGVIMLPLTFLMTLLARIILVELMPYIDDLIVALEDLGEWIDWIAIQIGGWVTDLEAMGVSWGLIFSALNSQKTEFDLLIIVLDTVLGLFEDINTAIGDIITTIQDWKTGGGFGGGDGGDDGNWWDPLLDWIPGQGDNQRSSSSSTTTNNSSNNININLQGSIISDRDKLIRDISEQVMIRIG